MRIFKEDEYHMYKIIQSIGDIMRHARINGVSIVMGVPQSEWFLLGKIPSRNG